MLNENYWFLYNTNFTKNNGEDFSKEFSIKTTVTDLR